ncbi:MAG TPA: FecR family protein [Terriglobales bacterium]|jgi:hypothetical protein|nr:FecR family protein [Terriglobales bacterium]
MAIRPWLGTASLLILLAAYFPPITYAATKDASDPQLVRLRYMQGDVRFNRGDGKHPDMKRPWEMAITNLPIEQNYALATGDGRAEIEFEDGSEVYVAENTLLLFTELTSADDVPTTKLELVSGTVTAGLQPLPGEFFEIDTPTGQIKSSFPQRSFVRIDAYLDGMELTPEMDTATEFDNDAESALLMKGQTVTFPDGAARRAAKPSEFRASDDFDKWAGVRYQARTVTMAAALEASGLTSPVVGLPDMYENGTFTLCPPYGMCWEPKQDARATPESSQLQPPTPATRSVQNAPQASLVLASSKSRGQNSSQTAPANTAQVPGNSFKSQTVWFNTLDTTCPFLMWTDWAQVAHTPQELSQLQAAAREQPWFFPVCHYSRWVHQGARFRPVIRRKRIHHPVHWVKLGKQTGFVPASPLDKKGKTPANLRHGIYVPSREDGIARIEHVDFKPAEKIEILASTPREFRVATQPEFAKAVPPEIRGRLLTETVRDSKLPNAGRSDAKITYDYTKQQFVRDGVAMAGRTSKPVVVSGLDSHGGFSSRESDRSNSGPTDHALGSGRQESSANRSSGSNEGGSRSGSESRSSSASSTSSSSSEPSRPK